MGKYYDAINGLKLAWERFRNPELLKWAAAYGIFSFIVGAVFSMLNAKGAKPQDAVALIFGICLAGLLVFIPASAYLYMKLIPAALGACKIPVSKKTKYFEFVVLMIRAFLAGIVSWYDLRLLALPIAGIALYFMGLGAAAAMPVLALPAILAAYALVIAYAIIASTRIGFAVYLYFTEGPPESGKPKKSHALVQGQTLEVFLAHLAVAIATTLPLVAISVLIRMVQSVLGWGQLGRLALDLVILIPITIVASAIQYAYAADVFGFYAAAGPAQGAAAPASAKALPSAGRAEKKKGKK